MTVIEFPVPRQDKPCISEWAVQHGFALSIAFCLVFWTALGLLAFLI